ncbi:putative toxin-antitoxin system toxin component, PIN family [Segetibacter sp.]|uniref:putative toxin-antitoxin system toxin component, PIN family n=1 Tax=Segetibacter sp. TaxID=2231182 RepID=UPI0026202D38|nr:putative toxin-antitoxin system toxin component, PIN family [Segetibacter sp.]MCW3079554.1 hypothetical protein [Segetibacter sp.]
MRIVVDTNVLLVSVSSKSPYHCIFQSILNGTIELCVTYDILLEYHEKIEEHMNAQTAQSVITTLINSPFVIETVRYFYFNLITNDADDNKFIDCAIAANAVAIVTEDKDFNVLKQLDFPSLKILTIVQLKELLEL